MTRKPRADAARNRQHIITVARAAFASDGPNASMRDIARRAGLGTATLYRHFPARTDLLAATLAENVAGCRADMRASLGEPDAWRALSGTIRRFAERQIQDRRLNDALLDAHVAAAAFAAERRAHARALEQLVDRARQAGVIRANVTADDVRVGLAAMASFRGLPPERAARSIQRLTGLLLAGISA
jgi:AcrR family transcriptional regulator